MFHLMEEGLMIFAPLPAVMYMAPHNIPIRTMLSLTRPTWYSSAEVRSSQQNMLRNRIIIHHAVMDIKVMEPLHGPAQPTARVPVKLITVTAGELASGEPPGGPPEMCYLRVVWPGLMVTEPKHGSKYLVIIIPTGLWPVVALLRRLPIITAPEHKR